MEIQELGLICVLTFMLGYLPWLFRLLGIMLLIALIVAYDVWARGRYSASLSSNDSITIHSVSFAFFFKSALSVMRITFEIFLNVQVGCGVDLAVFLSGLVYFSAQALLSYFGDEQNSSRGDSLRSITLICFLVATYRMVVNAIFFAYAFAADLAESFEKLCQDFRYLILTYDSIICICR